MGISTKAVSATVLASVVMIALAGCMQQPKKEVAPKSTASSVTTTVMSEQEALEIAEKTYGKYLEISNQIMQEGALHPEQLEKLLSPDQYSQEVETMSLIQERDQHLDGEVTFDGTHIQSVSETAISVYLCLDARAARIIDSLGNSPVLEKSRWPLLVTFSKSQDNQFIISGSETWTGTNFC